MAPSILAVRSFAVVRGKGRCDFCFLKKPVWASTSGDVTALVCSRLSDVLHRLERKHSDSVEAGRKHGAMALSVGGFVRLLTKRKKFRSLCWEREAYKYGFSSQREKREQEAEG